ncbi:FecR/PupR family sigma factor regulator, partial [Achromobacter xylosoxidans]
MTPLFRRSRPGGDPAAALKREAQAWVVRLASGRASVADGEAFRRWCGQSAEHARIFKETRSAWQQLAPAARQVQAAQARRGRRARPARR